MTSSAAGSDYQQRRPNYYVLITALLFGGIVWLSVLCGALAFVLWLAGLVVGGVPVEGVLEKLALGIMIGLAVTSLPLLLPLVIVTVKPRKASGGGVPSQPLPEKAVVVLTALDDEDAAPRVVEDFLSADRVAQVILVDNGSRDCTRERASAAGALVVLESLRGYGYACRRALQEGLMAGCPAVVLCEADCTFRAGDLTELLAYLQHADVVVGSRTHAGLLNHDAQLNSFLTLGNVAVAKLLQLRYWDWVTGGPVRLTDVGCTYTAIRAEALRRILPSLEVGSNHFIPHFLMVALEHGLRVVQVPVTFWKRVGISKGGNANWWAGFRLGLVMIWHILTYRVRHASALGYGKAEADREGTVPRRQELKES